MAFDIKTAKPVQDKFSGGFDISTAKPVNTSTITEKSIIPKPYGGLPGLKKLFTGGPIAYGSEPGAEDVLPALGQTVGTMIPGVNAFGGSVAGATAGQAGRQAVKQIRGYRESLPRKLFGVGPTVPGIVNDLAGEAAGTAAMEGAFRAVPKVLFPKQIGAKARDAAGRELGEIAKKVKAKAPFANTPKIPIVQEIDQAFKGNIFERGPAKQALAQVKKSLLGKRGPLTFDEAIQLERQLGREAQFASEATQGKFVKAPKAPKFNETIKGLRNYVSGKVDEMAADAGFPDYKTVSNKYAELMRRYPESELQKLYSPTGQFIRGASAASGALIPAAAGAGPVSVAIAPAAIWASLPPRFKTAIFRKAVDTPIGRGTGRALTIGAAEIARRANQS